MVSRKLAMKDEPNIGGSEELSNVATFSAGPSPHEDCLSEEVFVDDVRGVLQAERVKQARREEVQWCRGLGVWEHFLRKDMGAIAIHRCVCCTCFLHG